MVEFKTGICPKCGKKGVLMTSNNPLSGTTICFDCIVNNLNYKNIEHAEFFCRTYNLPWNPQLWMQLVPEYKVATFKEYTRLILEEKENRPNLAYESTTHDLWARTNKEWEKTRTFSSILNKIAYLKDSYIDRGHLKWGAQYTFEELIKLDSVYTRSLRANNITNPLQKEAVKTLCKLQIELDEAIRAKDAKAIKDFSTAYASFAKQADLEGMINETKTDDITTVAELYKFMEDNGFQFKFYDGYNRDEVDRAIKDITETNRRLILESTGLQPLLEEMAKKRQETQEEQYTQQVTEDTTLQDLLNFSPSDEEIAVEDDSEVLNEDFSEEEEKSAPVDVTLKE